MDDDAALRRLIRRVVERVPEVEVAAEAANGKAALALARENPPDIVLTDISMPEMDGVELTQRLLDFYPETRVVALTGAAPGRALSDMIRHGAVGYLEKTASLDEMIQGLQAVARGSAVLSPEATSLVLKDLVQHYRAEQQRSETLMALDAMKRDFMNVISHELKTPVTIIKGGVQTLRRIAERLDPEQQRTFLDSIEGQCLRLQRMIDQILIVSQIEKGSSGPGSTVSLSDLVHSVLAGLSDEDRERISLDPSETAYLAQGSAVRRTIGWILDNSLAFSEGPIRIWSVPRNSDHVVVHIADEGVGMDEELIRRVLTKPFSQNDSSATRAHEGLGLSLYASRQVLENLGGTLEIHSAPGSGTTVSLGLPVAAQGNSRDEPDRGFERSARD